MRLHLLCLEWIENHHHHSFQSTHTTMNWTRMVDLNEVNGRIMENHKQENRLPCCSCERNTDSVMKLSWLWWWFALHKHIPSTVSTACDSLMCMPCPTTNTIHSNTHSLSPSTPSQLTLLVHQYKSVHHHTRRDHHGACTGRWGHRHHTLPSGAAAHEAAVASRYWS